MVAFCHPFLTSTFLLVVIVFFTKWQPVICQVGLRTLPLTASQNHSKFATFSKWSENGASNPNANNPLLEMELAAILRDIAYGDSIKSTTSTTTSTTTQKPTTKTYFDIFKDSNKIQPPSSIPVSPSWEDELWNNVPNSENKDKTNQDHYVESPVLDPSENYDSKEDILFSEDFESGVIKSDVGVNEMPWISSLGVMWEVHVYTTAGLFSLLVLSSLYCLTRVYLSSQLLPRGYYITVHLLVFLAAFFRCVYFFHDPYAAAKLLPDGLSNILFNTGTPCIITALAVLILALLRTARLIILPLNLQSPVVVAVISGALVAGSIIIDVFGGLLKEQQIAPGLKGIMQALTAGWGAALCIGYIIVFIRIERAAKRQQNEIVRLTFSRLHIEGSSLPRRFPKSSLKFGARFTLIASLSGILLATLQVYGLINSEMVIDLPPLQPWIWLVYQTSCRILEIIMWTCICVASALPANLSKNERNKNSLDEGQFLTIFSCKKCTSCSNLSSCCIYKKPSTDDMYSTFCQTNHVARNFSINNTEKLIPQDTIASTGLPPKHISTTLLPPKTRKLLNKPSALQSAGSDAQLLWNNTTNANSSTSSRPSSLILTEGGLIKFRTHDPHSEKIRITNYPIKEYDSKIELHETQKKILEHSAEDNYINSGALTPEEKRMLETNFYLEKIHQQKENEANSDYQNVQEKRSGKVSMNVSPSKGVTSFNTINTFDTHFYEDQENYFYQSPSIDSSLESSGHIYASIQQPIDQSRHQIHQHKKKQDDNDNYQEKNFDNSNLLFQTPIHQRRPSSSNHSHLDIIPTDYLTDASQDHNDSPSDLRNGYLGSPGYFQPDGLFYQLKSNISPVHGYRCYGPEYNFQDHLNSPQQYPHTEDYDDSNLKEGKLDNNSETEDVSSGCPISPSQKKKFLNKNGLSNFENVSYKPLQGDEEQYSHQTNDSKIRHCGHRPRKTKLSPLSCNESSKSFAMLQSPLSHSSHHATIFPYINQENLEKEKKEAEKIESFFIPQRSPKEKEKLKQKLRDNSSPNETNSRIDFSPVNAHKFLSEGVPWTDLKISPKAPSESSSQDPSMEILSSDIHSEYIQTNDDSTKKTMEVRWPLKCKDETGV